MIRRLFHHIVPHHGNDHRPHLLRGRSVARVIAAALLLQALFTALYFDVLPADQFLARIMPQSLVAMANGERAERNLPRLEHDEKLQEAAELKARHMAENGYFSHTGPDGTDPWHWLEKAEYDYQYAGENLAVNFVDSKDVMRAWMESPEHRENVLNRHYTEIGIGTATGEYDGRETVFIVQYFGHPADALAGPGPASGDVQTEQQEETRERETNTGTAADNTTPDQPAESRREGDAPAEPPGEAAGAATEGSGTGTVTAGAESAGTTVPLVSRVTGTLASPHYLVSLVYTGLLGVFALAFLLKLAIRLEREHHPLLLNGLLVAVVIGALFVLTNHLALSQASILESAAALTP